MNWKSCVVLTVGLLAMAFVLSGRDVAQGQGGKGGSAGGATYSVVSTDGAHLIVTDNAASKLFFYAIDKDGKIGDELKLRGTVDLRDVGKPSIKPIDAKPQK